VARDVHRHPGGPQFLRLKATLFLEQGADNNALFIVQAGPVDGTWQVVQGKFPFAAGIDDGGKPLAADHARQSLFSGHA
jgi:hypothetical protein